MEANVRIFKAGNGYSIASEDVNGGTQLLVAGDLPDALLMAAKMLEPECELVIQDAAGLTVTENLLQAEIASALVRRARAGETDAIKEVLDTVYGRGVQADSPGA